jgi:hypothetical protein
MQHASVFATIFDSSIADNPALRHFFMDLLVLADQATGIVDMTPESIAAQTRLSVGDVRGWLAELEGPDERSRTATLNGARIVRLDPHREWGWRIVNWEQYQGKARTSTVRAVETARKQAYRNREVANIVPVSPRIPTASPAVEPPYGMPRSEQEAVDQGVFAGVTQEVAISAYHDAVSAGWVDKQQRRIMSFRSYAKKWEIWRQAKANEERIKSTNVNGHVNGSPRTQLLPSQRLKLMEEQAAKLAERITPLPGGEERSRLIAERRALVAQIDELKKKLIS